MPKIPRLLPACAALLFASLATTCARLYAFDSGRDQQHHCVHRVVPSTPKQVKTVYCNSLLGDDSDFTLSPDGKTALLSGSLRKGTQANTYWIRLSDGVLLQHVSMNVADAVLTNAGVMIAAALDGLLVMDLVTKETRVIPLGLPGDVWRNAWHDNHTIVVSVMRPKPDEMTEFEWVAVDISKRTAELEEPRR